MFFNSIEFLFVFLPVIVVIYFWLNRRHLVKIADYWLIAASFFFCGWLSVKNAQIMLVSIAVNYAIVCAMRRFKGKKFWLVSGIVFNVCFLGYYKYANFVVSTVNDFFAFDLSLQKIFLPLAISFFTFQQIAYLVDTYKKDTEFYSISDYLLFISFFPKLIAGPLVYHKDFLPQFKTLRNRLPNWENIYKGLLLFAMGLVKKVFIADRLSQIVMEGLAGAQMTMAGAWQTSLSYTFQLYFDFSGYCDMAMGGALMLNIVLPLNFNSPYKALNVQDFWRRWHITLSRWLMMYVYIPLGGNRNGIFRTYLNLFLVFLVGGIWHGAGGTYILWGMLHGAAMVCHRIWTNAGQRMPAVCGYLLTLFFVNLAWIFFRADSAVEAMRVIFCLFDFSSFSFKEISGLRECLFWIVLTKFSPNSNALADKLTENKSMIGPVLVAGSLLAFLMNANRAAEFIYANF